MATPKKRSDFLRDIIDADIASNKHGGRVVTRFPPEPNGYLHIGHAKSICLNFGIAQDYGGVCNLRFDDTNPEAEDTEYAESIQADVKWLGFEWDELRFASDYYERFYEYAVELIEKGAAYVDSGSEAEIREMRGTVTQPGTDSPHRTRGVEENLDLFARMRAGEFEDGAHVLRGKGDMAAANMKLRDPLLYRIRHATHYRTGDDWCIYPMYDFAHCLEDEIEGITHSICTLEFQNNRAIYDWVLDHVTTRYRPHQYEFARLSLEYTLMSKRLLLKLVEKKLVSGWDDPRMPTLAGLRRRGYTPESIRNFCDVIGVAKANSTVDLGKLEWAIRDDLNHKARRVMAVLRPLKVVLTNAPEDDTEWLEADYWPHDVPEEGTRPLPFEREIWIERDDFMEDPPPKFHRLAPGREVRLRHAYFIKCNEVVKNDAGEVVELRCSYDPETRGGAAKDGRKPKGTIHWVSVENALDAEVRLYDRLFETPQVRDLDDLNPNSLEVIEAAKVEVSLKGAKGGEHFQFERIGYFFVDPVDSKDGAPVFNRTVTLRDSWAKQAAGHVVAKSTVTGKTTVKKREVELTGVAVRYHDELGLSADDARLLGAHPDVSTFFEEALEVHDAPKSVANWVVNELLPLLGERPASGTATDAPAFARLVALVDEGRVSRASGVEVLGVLVAEGGDPARIVADRGLEQLDDDEALGAIVTKVIADNPEQVARFRDGKTSLLGFFVGQVMRATGGKADPTKVNELLRSQLGEG